MRFSGVLVGDGQDSRGAELSQNDVASGIAGISSPLGCSVTLIMSDARGDTSPSMSCPKCSTPFLYTGSSSPPLEERFSFAPEGQPDRGRVS